MANTLDPNGPKIPTHEGKEVTISVINTDTHTIRNQQLQRITKEIVAILLQNGIGVTHDEVQDFIKSGEDISGNPILMEEISTLKLSLRAINCLKSESITYMGDLVQRSPNELLKTPNLGSNTVRELQEIVLSRGLTLGMRIPNWDNRRLKREA